MKSLAHELIDSAVMNPSDGIKYWLTVAVLSAVACVLLLVAIIVEYFMKHGLIISGLLSY